jgi:PAS domain S-box-containing protein
LLLLQSKKAVHMVIHLQTRSRYEQMLAKSVTAAICASADHVIVSWNSAAEKLFGQDADFAIGSRI